MEWNIWLRIETSYRRLGSGHWSFKLFRERGCRGYLVTALAITTLLHRVTWLVMWWSMDKKIFTLYRSSPSGILLYGIRKHEVGCRARKTMKEAEKDNRRRRRKRTKRKTNFTGKKGKSRGLGGKWNTEAGELKNCVCVCVCVFAIPRMIIELSCKIQHNTTTTFLSRLWCTMSSLKRFNVRNFYPTLAL